MTYQLLQPALLIALAGLLLPFLIHLWNRRRGRVVQFGSIQWLEATKREKLSSLSFSQPWLFLLRALLIALCVLMLVEPVRVQLVQLLPQKNLNWVLVSPNLVEREDWQAAFDTVQYRDYEWRVLSAGFPEISVYALFRKSGGFKPTAFAKRSETPLNIWSLLADMQERADAPDSVAVFFSPALSQFQHQSPALRSHISWYEVPAVEDAYALVRSWRDGNKLTFLIGKSEAEQTTFERRIFRLWQSAEMPVRLSSNDLPDILADLNTKSAYLKNKKELAIPIEKKPVLRIAVEYDSSFKTDRNYIRAALKAVAKYTDIDLVWTKRKDEDLNALFWLSKKPLPDDLPPNTKVFLYQPEQVYREDMVTSQLLNNKKVHILTQRLRTSQATDQLPQRLLNLLLTPDDFDAQLEVFDQRKLIAEQYAVRQITKQSKVTDEVIEEKRVAGFHHWFWALLLFVFLLERVYAHMKTQNQTSNSNSKSNLQ